MSHIFIELWYHIKRRGIKYLLLWLPIGVSCVPALGLPINGPLPSTASVRGTVCTHLAHAHKGRGGGEATGREKQIITLQSFSCLDDQPLVGAGKRRCMTWPSVREACDCTGVQRREPECVCLCVSELSTRTNIQRLYIDLLLKIS